MTVVSLVIMNDDLSIEEYAVTRLAHDPNGCVNDVDANVWKNKGVMHDTVLISSLCNDARTLKMSLLMLLIIMVLKIFHMRG